MFKTYLGDAVYAEWQESTFSVILTTEDGFKATNTIVLEAEVLYALDKWIRLVMIRRHTKKDEAI